MKGEPPDQVVRRFLKLCGAALLLLAIVTAGIGLFRVWTSKPLEDEGVPLGFARMLGFALVGFAFYGEGADRRAWSRWAAVALLVLALGTLALYLAGGLAGIDVLSYDLELLGAGQGFHARMSPSAAVSFALIAASFLLLAARRLRLSLLTPCLALLLALSLLGVIGHVTGLRVASAWWRYTAMALPSASVLLVAAATLVVWLIRRMSAAREAVARTLPFFLVAGTAVLVLGGVVMVSNEQRVEATLWMNHTLQVDAAIDRFISSVARLESSTRAYALTGDDTYLERIEVHRQNASATATQLIELTIDNPVQYERALALRPLIARKLAVNVAQVAARRTGGTDAAAQVLRAEPPEIMAGLRASTDALQAEERRVAQRRREQTEVGEARLTAVLLVGALVTIALVGAAFALVHRAQRELQSANEQLEARVIERTAEVEAGLAQLRESERRLRFLADTMPQLVWTARPDGSIESVNRGYLLYLGKSEQSEAIAALRGIVHPEDQPAALREWEAMQREARPAGGELRLRRHDGVYRWHLWRAHPEHDAAGVIVRWVGTSTDIHDQKMAEEQLERRVAERTAEFVESEERFRQAFYFAGTGMAIVALDGRWLRVNKSICEIVGYSEPELLQKTFQDITHPDDLQADLNNVRELLAGVRRFYQMEKRYFHSDGHTVWVRLTVSLIRDTAGQPVHFVSQIEDITEQKVLEKNLAAARDQALEASRLKSEFLATMSHEIRTPMNGVIGMTALLRDTPLTPTQADYVRTIESSGESLLTIINDILDYSKIEAGRIELEVAPFELRSCVEQALDLFTGAAREKGIVLRQTIAPAAPEEVAGDATRLRQILVNLVGNAVKFTRRGEVVVSVEAEAIDPVTGEQRLHFAIRDTGIGIPPAGMERLFKSFSQVDASTTRRFGGTGLGLAISKRLAELMGGTIWAESRVGEGSTFHFTVLVEPRSGSSAGAGQAAAAAADPKLGERCPLRLLVAEDNAVNQRVANLLLQRLGYRATTVANGLEALAAVKLADYDAILMDVEMPELDGCEATRRIRELRPASHRPWIIALTAGAMQDDRERAYACGMNDFLTKPVRADALSAALARAHAGLNGDA